MRDENLIDGRKDGTKYKTRRAYKYNYDDVGNIVGRNGKSCRQWMSNNNLKLDSAKPSESLKAVILYVSRITSSKSPVILIPSKVAPPKFNAVSDTETGEVYTRDAPTGVSPALAKMEAILRNGPPKAKTGGRSQMATKYDRYQELYLQGAHMGEYDDYSQDEVDEMKTLKAWLQSHGKAVA